MSISNIKLHLIKDDDHNNNNYSKLLVKYLQDTNNLKKITHTCKHPETAVDKSPYITYTKNNIEYKLSDYYKINEILSTVNHINYNTTVVYNEMMETRHI